MMKTPEVMKTWVDQEGDRFKDLLKERGFLNKEDTETTEAIRTASLSWRETYLQDIHPESLEWKEGHARSNEVLKWRLAGWNGWKSYRPEGKRFTTFQDVVTAIDKKNHDIPAAHLDQIPVAAAEITEILNNSIVIIIRHQSMVAVLEGTHRMSALAYAAVHHLPIPDEFRVIETTLPETEDDSFDRFCTNLPVLYGPYKTKH